MLQLMDRHPFRPAHIHIIVSFCVVQNIGLIMQRTKLTVE